MKRVMLYFGSFNPPHLGHLAIAEYVLQESISDEVWFVVSPANPLKSQWQLAKECDRLAMTQLAIEGRDRLRVCDVEFGMQRPSYTIDTLTLMSNEYADVEFSLLIGGDIIPQFEQWKSWQEIIERYPVYVYPRNGYDDKTAIGADFHRLDNAPVLPISSTLVRQTIEQGGSIKELVADGVANYIAEHNLYKLTAEYYLERGKTHYSKGEFGAALNDFMRAQEIEECLEAKHFETMVRSILDFRYTDIYNP